MQTTIFTMPYLPGVLRFSAATLDPVATVQVREMDSSEGRHYLVGIAHLGQFPVLPVNVDKSREWHNLAITLKADDLASATEFARRVHDMHLDSYGADILEAVEYLKSGDTDAVCRIAMGRKFGSVTAFLDEAAKRYQADVQDTLDEIARITF